jgi:hypothetical protein
MLWDFFAWIALRYDKKGLRHSGNIHLSTLLPASAQGLIELNERVQFVSLGLRQG